MQVSEFEAILEPCLHSKFQGYIERCCLKTTKKHKPKTKKKNKTIVEIEKKLPGVNQSWQHEAINPKVTAGGGGQLVGRNIN